MRAPLNSTQPSAGRSAGVLLVVAGVASVGAAYAGAIVSGAAPTWAPWGLAIGASASACGLFVLGAVTRGAQTRAVWLVLGGVFGVLVAAFGAALAMAPDEGAGGRLLLGLPTRLAIVFYGVGFLPLLVLPVAFGLTFDVRDDDRDGDARVARPAEAPGAGGGAS